MSATIGNFYERVSRAIRRGIVYDDDIPGYASDAVRELENSTNWKYMWNEVSGNLVVSTTDNTLAFAGSPLLKNVRFIKLIALSGDHIPIRKTQRENVIGITSGRPGAFWMLDKNTVKLDAFPNKAYAYQAGYYAYSVRPLVDSLEWLTLAEDLLIARTIRKMQPILRDDKLIARWQEIENSVLPALLEAEVVSEFDGEDSGPVPFTLEVEEDTAEGASFT